MLSEEAMNHFARIVLMKNYPVSEGKLFTVVQRADPSHRLAKELAEAELIIWDESIQGLARWLYTQKGVDMWRLLCV